MKYWKIMSGEKNHFVPGDKLPTVYDAAVSYSKLQRSQTRKKCKYTCKKLSDIHCKTFTIIKN